jgi:hypothetical protein
MTPLLSPFRFEANPGLPGFARIRARKNQQIPNVLALEHLASPPDFHRVQLSRGKVSLLFHYWAALRRMPNRLSRGKVNPLFRDWPALCLVPGRLSRGKVTRSAAPNHREGAAM